MLHKIKAAILGKGHSPIALRKKIDASVENHVLYNKALMFEQSILNSYLSLLSKTSYKITNESIHSLKTEGYSEDEIFEIMVTTAVSAGMARLKLGKSLL